MVTCAVDGCGKPVKKNGYCYAHYMKSWRYGTPTPVHKSRTVDLLGRRFGTLTVVERVGLRWLCLCDCGRMRTTAAGDLNRYPESSTCGDWSVHHRTKDAGYGAAHDRVRSDLGRVQQYACVGCGKQAAQWSYNHDDPDELLDYGKSKNPLAYSLDPSHYSPRCVSCHKRFDLDRINSTAQVTMSGIVW